MSKATTAADKSSAGPAAPEQEPGEAAVRDYAYHLYEESNCAPGHDVANWLEAVACLKAHIPAHASRNRLHQHLNGPGQLGSLVSSPAEARRESALLRRERESMEDLPAATDADVRTSLFDDHP